jgi:hypothetical protein
MKYPFFNFNTKRSLVIMTITIDSPPMTLPSFTLYPSQTDILHYRGGKFGLSTLGVLSRELEASQNCL